MILMVKVKNGHERIEVDGQFLIVYTDEPRENGRANIDVLKQISRYFKVGEGCVRIVKGLTTARKTIIIDDNCVRGS